SLILDGCSRPSRHWTESANPPMRNWRTAANALPYIGARVVKELNSQRNSSPRRVGSWHLNCLDTDRPGLEHGYQASVGTSRADQAGSPNQSSSYEMRKELFDGRTKN